MEKYYLNYREILLELWTNKSQKDRGREVGLPREISLFSFPLWIPHTMEEFCGRDQEIFFYWC